MQMSKDKMHTYKALVGKINNFCRMRATFQISIPLNVGVLQFIQSSLQTYIKTISCFFSWFGAVIDLWQLPCIIVRPVLPVLLPNNTPAPYQRILHALFAIKSYCFVDKISTQNNAVILLHICILAKLSIFLSTIRNKSCRMVLMYQYVEDKNKIISVCLLIFGWVLLGKKLKFENKDFFQSNCS